MSVLILNLNEWQMVKINAVLDFNDNPYCLLSVAAYSYVVQCHDYAKKLLAGKYVNLLYAFRNVAFLGAGMNKKNEIVH